MATVLPCAGYYLLASSNPDVSSGAYNWWMVVVETPLAMHTYKIYSIFLPMGRVLSACLCWSLLPSKCATYHHTIHLCFCKGCSSYHCWIYIVIYIPTPHILHAHSFPDVMLESYHVFPYSPIFFVIYLIITLYIIANVVSTWSSLLLNISWPSYNNVYTTPWYILYRYLQ